MHSCHDALPATISRPDLTSNKLQRERAFSTRGSGNLITGRGGPGLFLDGLMRGCLVRPIGGCNTSVSIRNAKSSKSSASWNAKSVSIGCPGFCWLVGFISVVRTPCCDTERTEVVEGSVTGAENEPPSETGKIVDPTTLLFGQVPVCPLYASRLRKVGRLEPSCE